MIKIETNGAANIIMMIDAYIMFENPDHKTVELLNRIKQEAIVLIEYMKELGNASNENRNNLMWHEIKNRMQNK